MLRMGRAAHGESCPWGGLRTRVHLGLPLCRLRELLLGLGGSLERLLCRRRVAGELRLRGRQLLGGGFELPRQPRLALARVGCQQADEGRRNASQYGRELSLKESSQRSA